MKIISRSEMNQLMAIPEAQQILKAKFAELRLIFKDKINGLKENGMPGQPEPQDLQESETSNIIPLRLPSNLPGKKIPGKEPSTCAQRGRAATAIKIIDACGYRYATEEERVRMFMDFFRNNRILKKAILDEFFFKILPYSDIAANGQGYF